MSVTPAPRHARAPDHHHLMSVISLAVSLLAVALAALALARAPRAVTLYAPPPAASATAAVPGSPPVIAPPAPARPRPAPVSRYVVRPGDSLWTVAAGHYGTGRDWTRIYAANRTTVGPDPDVIRPGQRLVIPGIPKGAQ